MSQQLNWAPQMKKGSAAREQKAKASTGQISGVANAVSDLAGAVASFPFLPPQISMGATALAGAAGLAGGVASLFGFDKPQTIQGSTKVLNETFTGLATGEGVFDGQEMNIQEGMHGATDAQNFCAEYLDCALLDLACKPGLFNIYTFDGTALPGNVVFKHWVTPDTAYTTTTAGAYRSFLTPCAAVSSEFKYWRGPIDYRYEFVCSSFVTVRVRIAWHPTFAEIPAVGSPLGQGEGDIVSTILDITGDTSFNFSIPYLKNLLYARSQDPAFKSEDYCNGGISVSIVNTAVAMNTTAATTVYVNAYMAAGKTMKFHVLCDKPTGQTGIRSYSNNVTPLATFVPQMAEESKAESNVLNDIFKHEFPTLVPATGKVFGGVANSENIENIYTLLHKPTIVVQIADVLTPSYTLSTSLPGNRCDPTLMTTGVSPWVLYSTWAMYYKGGFNHYITDLGGAATTTVLVNWHAIMFNMINGNVIPPQSYQFSTSQSSSNTPELIQSLSDRAGFMFHEPYRSILPFSTTTNATGYGFAGNNRENTVGIYYTAYGTDITGFCTWAFSVDDEFRFAWMVGPPALELN